jgi:hypothetical protein
MPPSQGTSQTGTMALGRRGLAYGFSGDAVAGELLDGNAASNIPESSFETYFDVWPFLSCDKVLHLGVDPCPMPGCPNPRPADFHATMFVNPV